MPTGLEANAVTFIPYTNTFYVGAIEEGMNVQGRAVQNYEPIAKLDPSKLEKSWNGHWFEPNENYSGSINDALEPIGYEHYRRAERYQKKESGSTFQAAVDVTSLANITRVVLLTEIRNRQYKDVFLINGVDKIPVPKLKLDYDIQLHIKARGAGALVPKRQKPHVETPDFVQASFDMVAFGKLARVIDTTDEDELSALISPIQKALDDLAGVMSLDENLLIKTELDKFVDKTKGSWSAFTGDHNTRNPLKDLQTERKRITNNHGRTNIMAMNSILWADFVGNTFVKGFEQMMTQEQPGIITFSKLPGITFIIDEDVPDGEAYYYDRRAMTYGEGPMVSESFRDPQAGVSGHVIRKWVEPLIPTTLQTSFGAHLKSL